VIKLRRNDQTTFNFLIVLPFLAKKIISKRNKNPQKFEKRIQLRGQYIINLHRDDTNAIVSIMDNSQDVRLIIVIKCYLSGRLLNELNAFVESTKVMVLRYI